jgi:hypothetical protein
MANNSIDSLFQQFQDKKNEFVLLQKKGDDLKAIKKPKLCKKEELLQAKLDSTLTIEGELELENIESDERIELIKLKGIEDARRKYESLVEFYETQATQMKARTKRTFDVKKRNLEGKQRNITIDKIALEGNKSSAEYANDRKMTEVAKEMKAICRMIKMSQIQLMDARIPGVDATPRPVPEYPLHSLFQTPLVAEVQVEEPPKKAVQTSRFPCDCGRNCPQVPLFRGSKELTYRCWAEAEQAQRQALEAQERKEESELTQPINIQQSPLTPFQGLPPPDVQRAIKPTKMVKTSLGTYATKMYATPIEII